MPSSFILQVMNRLSYKRDVPNIVLHFFADIFCFNFINVNVRLGHFAFVFSILASIEVFVFIDLGAPAVKDLHVKVGDVGKEWAEHIIHTIFIRSK